MNLRSVFDDLVRFETTLWNDLDGVLRERAGITLGTLGVLQVAEGRPGCRVGDLATALAITIGGASQAADRLVAKGLLERSAHPTDRRAAVLTLTADGDEVLRTATPVFDAALGERFGSALSVGELATFAELLARLRTSAAGPASG